MITKTILTVADLHGSLPSPKSISNQGGVDIICMLGDNEPNFIENFTPGIMSNGKFTATSWNSFYNYRMIDREKEARTQEKWVEETLIPWTKEIPHNEVIYLNGNHSFGNFSKLFKYYARDDTKNFEIEGIKFSLIPGVGNFLKEWFGEMSEEDFSKLILKADPSSDIILTHSPCFGILDDNDDKLHIGFKSLYDSIFGGAFGSNPIYFKNAKYFFHGHVHNRAGKKEFEIEGRKVIFVNSACKTKRIKVEI